ncbi:hypothetical protein KDA_25090 [Dictyobacter alpinus]|uniref:Uncharacterized protein n=1 Tax=Dictyobacter alpinus TaxID=2014873 RepID=A0A402B6Q0_9CHLR|nr:hypothetical protein [Dictyobacter alpinus]GCE27025.1 hypothetical protein KDA_25090 [Dictyobacter alpinus]
MKIQDEQKIEQCAFANTDIATALAVAGTLCAYGGSSRIRTGVNLMIDATIATQIGQAYTALMQEFPQEDIYNVSITEPVHLQLTNAEGDFDIILQDFTRHLLYLYSALHNLHLSYARYQAAKNTLDDTYHNPAQSEVFQDARTFATLQRQAIWRHLMLCSHLHTDVLMSASRVNLLWHKFKQQLPNQSIFTSHEVSEVVTMIWHDNAQEIAEYNLAAFGIQSPPEILNLLRNQPTLQRPILLLDNQWHKYMSQLEQSYQQTLDTFYNDEDK